ncbi:hypothetical protein [Pseudactinotalea terrae]|uniref:hypothetical protein n=1 Tax=Pseudactinotalea terrae TaxID=1743262 RepID=UPI0012E19D3A|nr:hypothetical protein [Pseudactinotalea terrae]
MRRMKTAALVLVLGFGLAACGSGGAGDEPPDSAPAGEESSDMAEETTDSAPGEATMLGVASSDVGDIVVDGTGMTLYMFTQDSEGMSACSGDCLAAWPPLEGEPSAGEGVDESLLGSIERDDGSTQATYGGWPLYYFAQDAQPGDLTGQGVNEVWYALSPAGEPIMEAAPADASGY